MRVSGRVLLSLVLVLATIVNALEVSVSSAAQITSRYLTLQKGVTDGGSKPSGVVDHYFAFTLPGGSDVGSIKFEYCDIAVGLCTKPTGLTTTSAGLGSENGATGFAITNTNDGAPYLWRTPSAVAGNTPVAYQLTTITNPSATNSTFFVRIATYASNDTTGIATDTGVVAASTTTQIELSGIMPESLVFCTGSTIGTTLGVPDCTLADNGLVDFNQLFSPTATATATSQMAASTNAEQGYIIAVWGETLTSGANTIDAMAAPGPSAVGTQQFGLNLRENTVTSSNPLVGIEVIPASNAGNLRGRASGDYASVDQFKFVSGNTVAASDDPAPGASDAQIFTVSYIVNVPGSQTAGTYTTTLTYVCTATF